MTDQKETTADEMKELLSDPKKAIQLDDFVSSHIKYFLEKADLEHFPVQGANIQNEDIAERIEKYEEVSKDLQIIVTLLARWSDQEKLLLLEKIFDRLIEAETGTSGLTVWLRMRWYPILLLLYATGIGAIAAKKYCFFGALMMHQVEGNLTDNKRLPLVGATFIFSGEIHDYFKLLPGLDRRYAARSERIFATLQPVFEDLLFLGKSYDRLFDEFEIYSSLMCMDSTAHGWGPIGKFGWKYDRGEDSPFHQVAKQIEQGGDDSELLRAGCFNGSTERSLELVESLRERLNKLGWW